MHQWPILVLACLALCGCQSNRGPVSDADCPYVTPCGDPDLESMSPLGAAPMLIRAVYLIPGCPASLQVMAHPIAFHAIRTPDLAPGTADDPADSTCAPPDAPLLRTDRRGPRQDLADR